MAVEFDEFGAGHGKDVHATLFAELMKGAGLDAHYGRYLDFAPAVTPATVNVMSLFGLHRALRGAAVGNFATLEITSPPGAQVMRHDVIGDLLVREPELSGDVAFGIRATVLLDSRWEEHVLDAWQAGHSSLRPGAPDISGAHSAPH